MTTEDISPRYLDFELWNNDDALKALFEEQMAAVAAVRPVLSAIGAAVDDAVPRLRRGGRLVYVGAGTSGRIAVQDGAELPPTFNWPHERLALVMAGGDKALVRSVEGAEDSEADGAKQIEELAVGPDDVVLGLAASGNTPFTVAAIKAAKALGAMTVGIANNKRSKLLAASGHAILVETGAEPIAGSTRFKAGTAQKVVLNLFSTLLMTRLGKVYRGLMVHMRATNDKLRRRSVRMVAAITGCDIEIAEGAISKGDGDVKVASLIVRGLNATDARALLKEHEDNLRLAMEEIASR